MMRDSGHDEIGTLGHNRGDGAVVRDGEAAMCILSVLVFRNAAVGGLMRWRKGVGGKPPFFAEDDLVKLDRDTRGAKRRWEDESVVTLWDGGEDEVDDGSATTQLWSRAHLEVHFHTGQCIRHEKHWISLTCSTREPVRGGVGKVAADLDAHAVQSVNRVNYSPQCRRYRSRRQQPLLLHTKEGHQQ